MTQTFTPDLDLTAKKTEKEPTDNLLEHAEPSLKTIQTILNYSKNLEIKSSALINDIEVIKS
jgi:hypothetical protein